MVLNNPFSPMAEGRLVEAGVARGTMRSPMVDARLGHSVAVSRRSSPPEHAGTPGSSSLCPDGVRGLPDNNPLELAQASARAFVLAQSNGGQRRERAREKTQPCQGCVESIKNLDIA